MQFNITFKTIFEYVLKKLVLCIQIRFVSTEKTTRIASRASCFIKNSKIIIFYIKSKYFRYTLASYGVILLKICLEAFHD